MKRRQLLGGAASLALAGCSSAGDSAADTPPPTATDCAVAASSALPDADAPSNLTKRSAKSAAGTVQDAYAFEQAKTEGWFVDGVDWAEYETRAFDGGFFVHARVSIDAHEPKDSGTVYHSQVYEGRYRVTTEKIQRAPVDWENTPPENWTTVACAGDDTPTPYHDSDDLVVKGASFPLTVTIEHADTGNEVYRETFMRQTTVEVLDPAITELGEYLATARRHSNGATDSTHFSFGDDGRLDPRVQIFVEANQDGTIDVVLVQS